MAAVMKSLAAVTLSRTGLRYGEARREGTGLAVMCHHRRFTCAALGNADEA